MLRRNFISAGMLLVLASITVTATAQPGGGPGGPGGFGGFLGRMAGGSSSILLMMPDVQKELNITDDQKTQLRSLAGDVGKAVQDAAGQVDFRSMSQEERQKAMEDFQKKSPEERQKTIEDMQKKSQDAIKKFDVDGKLAKILDDKQVKRLKELELQFEGATALLRPEVVQKLGLSQEQQDKIKKIQDDARPNFTRDPNQTQEERQAQFQKIRDKMASAQKDSLAVLNDDQMLDWTNMCGKTFKFPAFGGFGRGNRPQPPQNNP